MGSSEVIKLPIMSVLYKFDGGTLWMIWKLVHSAPVVKLTKKLLYLLSWITPELFGEASQALKASISLSAGLACFLCLRRYELRAGDRRVPVAALPERRDLSRCPGRLLLLLRSGLPGPPLPARRGRVRQPALPARGALPRPSRRVSPGPARGCPGSLPLPPGPSRSARVRVGGGRAAAPASEQPAALRVTTGKVGRLKSSSTRC